MKRVASTLLLLCIAVLPRASEGCDEAGLLPAALTELRASSVPVLLPSQLPPWIGVVRSVVLIAAGPRGYYVSYSTVPHCTGGLSCAVVHIAGFPGKSRALGAEPLQRRVRLADGATAHYMPRNCAGTHCSQGSLTFTRGRYRYEIDANTARDDLPTLRAIYRKLQRVR